MQKRWQVVLLTIALSLNWIGAASGQREISEEESARLTKLLEPWGTWTQIRVFPGPSPDGLILSLRKDPQATKSNIPTEVCEQVKSVVLYDRLADADIDRLFAIFPKINSITVAKTAWSTRIGIKAAELSGLKDLWVGGCDLAPEDLKAIGKIESLEILMLSGNKRIGPALDSLSDLTQLRQLSLSGVPIPEFKKIKWLANNVNLTTLWLTDTGIGDEAVPTLKALPQLAFVFVDDTTSSQRLDELHEILKNRNKPTPRK